MNLGNNITHIIQCQKNKSFNTSLLLLESWFLSNTISSSHIIISTSSKQCAFNYFYKSIHRINSRNYNIATKPIDKHDNKYNKIDINSSEECPVENKNCWQCGASLENNRLPTQNESDNVNNKLRSAYCASCGLPQESALNLDYFTLFSLPKSFNVSLQLLDSAYKRLQKKLHPDRFIHNQSDIGRNKQFVSSQLSSRVNYANSILRDPYSRSIYLMNLAHLKVRLACECVK